MRCAFPGAILPDMQRLCVFIAAFAAYAALFADSADFEKIFRERAKSCATVKYIFEAEELRREITASGTVATKDGIILLPSSAIPYYWRPSNLKDFRVFFDGGDSDGYRADFLGVDVQWSAYFIKLRDGLPEGLRPVTDFKEAGLSVGQDVWGAALAPDLDSVPLLYRSYVAVSGMSEKGEAVCALPVAGTGLPAFDSAGNFVGWGQDAAVDSYTFYLRNGDSGPIELCDDLVTRVVIPAENFRKILERVPSRPEGDKIGWLGIADVQAVKRDAAKFLGIEKIGAVAVGRVFDGSPAEKAGIKRGDIIVSLDGKDLPRMKSDANTLASFVFKMEGMKPGQKRKLGVLRGDKTVSVDFEAAAYPLEFRESRHAYFKRLGFSVREFVIGDAMARKMQKPAMDAPVVQFVKPNSPASSAQPNGLGGSEIIREINSVPVKSYAHAVEILSKINSDKSAGDLVILSEDYKETKLLRIKLD